MTEKMNHILERVLSEELGRQDAWLEEDRSMGFDVSNRKSAIDEIHEFMMTNDISIRQDFYYSAYHSIKRA